MSETEHRHAGEMLPSGLISLKSIYHTVQVPDMYPPLQYKFVSLKLGICHTHTQMIIAFYNF